MRGKAPLSRDSYVRDLPFGVQRRLAFELDLSNLWENLVVEIPKHLNYSDEDDFIPRYTSQHVRHFALQQQIPSGSPTRTILQDWGTQNCTIQHLLDALTRAKLTAAANLIRYEVLKECDDDEDDEVLVDELRIPTTLLPPMFVNAVPGDHHHRVQQAQRQPTETISELGSLKKVQEPEQNDLSSTSQLSLADKSVSDKHTQKHDRQYVSMGGAGALAESPNLNRFIVSCEKPFGKSWDKKIGQDLLQPDPQLSSHTLKCKDEEIEPVIKNTGMLQHIPYRDLEEITDSFSEMPYLSGGRMIGKGGFGMVHLGVDRDERLVAVKVLKDQTDTVRKQFRTEVDTLSGLKNENLLTLLGYSCDGPRSCIVYDYMPNGSLEDRLSCKNGTKPLPAELRISICKGAASGISFLNNLGYIHRDIKSANILLDKDFVPKLGDFATTRLGPSGAGDTQAGTSILIGTSAYLAPEAHNFDVSAKLDSFSFGVVILELITGLPAYDANREDRDLRSHVLENCEDIMLMVDRYGGEWIESSVRVLYSVACKCLENYKRRRALVKDVLDEIHAL